MEKLPRKTPFLRHWRRETRRRACESRAAHTPPPPPPPLSIQPPSPVHFYIDPTSIPPSFLLLVHLLSVGFFPPSDGSVGKRPLFLFFSRNRSMGDQASLRRKREKAEERERDSSQRRRKMAVGEGVFAEGKKGKGGKISNWNKEKREEHMARRFQGKGERGRK